MTDGSSAVRATGAVRLASARLGALDGLRGFSAVMVVLYHLQANDLIGSNALLASSSMFVDVFFVLSGFVMVRTYGQRLDTGPHIRRYMLRRFGRVWPLHATILAAMLAFHTILSLVAALHGVDRPVFQGDHSAGAFIASLLLVQGMGLYDYAVWNGPAWSISVEFYTYLIFAVVCYFASRRLMAVSLLFVLACWLTVHLINPDPQRFGILRCLMGFFGGVIVWLLFERFRPALQQLSDLLLTVVQVVLIGAVLAVVAGGGSLASDLLSLPVFGALVFVLATNRGAVVRLLSGTPFSEAGDWSYSIYMVHIPFLNFQFRLYDALAPRLPWLDLSHQSMLFLLTYGVGVLVISAMLFRYVEMPARDAFASWSNRMK